MTKKEIVYNKLRYNVINHPKEKDKPFPPPPPQKKKGVDEEAGGLITCEDPNCEPCKKAKKADKYYKQLLINI